MAVQNLYPIKKLKSKNSKINYLKDQYQEHLLLWPEEIATLEFVHQVIWLQFKVSFYQLKKKDSLLIKLLSMVLT